MIRAVVLAVDLAVRLMGVVVIRLVVVVGRGVVLRLIVEVSETLPLGIEIVRPVVMRAVVVTF